MATTTTLIPTRQAQLWTKKGLGRLGFLIRQARLDLGWSMDRLALAVFHKTGEQIAKKTIGNIENNVGFPQYNSLAAIAALKIVKSSTGRPLDHHDFVDIASENYELTPMDIKNMIGCAMLINRVRLPCIKTSINFRNPYPIKVLAIRQKAKKLVSCLETLDIQRVQRFNQKISIMLQIPVSCYKSCNMILISIFFDMSETLTTKRLGAFYRPKHSNPPRLTLIEN